VDKLTLLASMQEHFGLKYAVSDAPVGINATGSKRNYYSTSHKAAHLFGYLPQRTSLDVLLEQTHQTLQLHD
jgi:hypothetical protein